MNKNECVHNIVLTFIRTFSTLINMNTVYIHIYHLYVYLSKRNKFCNMDLFLNSNFSPFSFKPKNTKASLRADLIEDSENGTNLPLASVTYLCFSAEVSLTCNRSEQD